MSLKIFSMLLVKSITNTPDQIVQLANQTQPTVSQLQVAEVLSDELDVSKLQSL